jgi:hypothetical protein
MVSELSGETLGIDWRCYGMCDGADEVDLHGPFVDRTFMVKLAKQTWALTETCADKFTIGMLDQDGNYVLGTAGTDGRDKLHEMQGGPHGLVHWQTRQSRRMEDEWEIPAKLRLEYWARDRRNIGRRIGVAG